MNSKSLEKIIFIIFILKGRTENGNFVSEAYYIVVSGTDRLESQILKTLLATLLTAQFISVHLWEYKL